VDPETAMTNRPPAIVLLLAAGALTAPACKDTPTAPSDTRPGMQAAWHAAAPAAATAAAGGDHAFTREFRLEDCDFQTTGDNPFFPLLPGLTLFLEGEEDGERIRLRIRVQHQTRVVGGVRTRVVEEREHIDGELVEISRNYFAHCRQNGTVFYFGEEVDIYEDGKIVSHEGAWLHGENGARAGVIMPGLPLIGARYFQEIAPGVALDRAEVLDVSATVPTPYRRFGRALLTRETTPLEPADLTEKVYAPGIGLVVDAAARLVRVERP
jgi:hypothetical protein